MELSELSSTQHSVQQQGILVNAKGDPLKINLQAVELEGRPKLVRTLKSSGASVVSNTKEAAIILVDSTTESGKRLIRTWGHDPSKVVLEHTWARASIDAGRPLLEADNWGGAMTVDDGKPVTIDGVVVDEDELEEVEALVTKSPLPTPRVTPVDPPQQPEHTVPETRSECNTVAQVTGRVVAEPPVVQPGVVPPTLPEEPIADTQPEMQPLQSPQPPPAQPYPYTQPGPVMQPPQSQNTYAYAPFGTQPGYPSAHPQMIPAQPFSHVTFPSSQPQTIHVPTIPHAPLPPAQSQMMQMSSNATTYNGVNLQTPNLATLMTIMEVVRHMDPSSWFGQNQIPMIQPLLNPQSSAATTQPSATLAPATASVLTPPASTSASRVGTFDDARGDPLLPSSENHAPSETATSSRRRQASMESPEGGYSVTKSRSKPSRRRSDEKLTPAISRKRPPVVKPTNPPPKRLRKGKEKAISPESSEESEVDDLMGASDDPHPTHSSVSPPAHPRNIIARKKHGELFLSDSGQPLRFFVQVDLHGRHNVVSNIKKNKGKIVNNIADSDYLILFTRSDTFQGLLNEALALDKVPIQSTFVADCIEEGALLDEADYILEPAAKIKGLKRGRQSAYSIKVETPITMQPKTVNPKSSVPKQEAKKSSDTPSKSVVDKRVKKKKTQPSLSNSLPPSKPNSAVAGSSSSGSPPPPPVETRQLMKSGKYLFTQLEDEYVMDLAKHHLARDPTISNTALICKVHKKMPHHSSASWSAHVDQKMKGALDDVRKRANIAKRKNSSEVAAASSIGIGNEDAPPKRPRLDLAEAGTSHPARPSRQEDLERQDFEVITHFFASGGGDDDDDERVWQELEKHSRCMSASSWPEYYAAHQNEVYARIEELMNERAGE